MKKSRTTPFDEVERTSENIQNQFKHLIKDKDTYNQVIESYIGKPESKKQERFLDQVFQHMQSRHPNRISKEQLFTKAGGKNLARDRKTTSKNIVKTKREYIQKGASKVDLQGYDTKTTAGTIKGKVVIVSQEKIVVKKGRLKGRTFTRYRDSKGRFARVKK